MQKELKGWTLDKDMQWKYNKICVFGKPSRGTCRRNWSLGSQTKADSGMLTTKTV
jgi:hypothetical protein